MALYLLWAYFFDKAKATGNCFEGVITKIDRISTGSGIRSGGIKSTDYYAHIAIEGGTKLVKEVSSSRKNDIGKKVHLIEFRSRIRGVTKYQIASCN